MKFVISILLFVVTTTLKYLVVGEIVLSKTDFDDGTLGNDWIDESSGDENRWKVQDPSEAEAQSQDFREVLSQSSVRLETNSRYLRLMASSSGYFSVASLRLNRVFQSSSSDGLQEYNISLRFWLQTKYQEFSSLDVSIN